jgi:hypothetical protein
MRKLRLELETLAVESFRTTRETEARGTVDAYNAYTNSLPTCWYHCTYLGQTCEACAREGTAAV